MEILFEDDQIIVCRKDPGEPSQADKSFTPDLVSKLKVHVKEHEPKSGIPYIGVVHRLDRPVGGVMVYAKTSQAASHLSAQITRHEVQKTYLAVVMGSQEQMQANKQSLQEHQVYSLCDYLYKDPKTNLSRVVTKNQKDAKEARLEYEVIESMDHIDEQKVLNTIALLKINLLTGRHHQIRVQLSNHLCGIYGDTKYHPAFQTKRGWYPIGRFAYQLSFLHPVTKKRMTFQSIPDSEPFSWFEKLDLLSDTSQFHQPLEPVKKRI